MLSTVKRMIRPLAQASGYLEWRDARALASEEELTLRTYPDRYFETRIGHKNLRFRTLTAREKVWFHARYKPGDLHERAASEEFMRRVAPGDVVLDVGAYFGWYSCVAASLGARAVALEVDADNFAVLGYNVALNELWSVETVQAAAWDSSADVSLLRDNYSVSPERAIALQGVPSSEIARALALDDLLDGKGIRPTVIKIDVEGAETAVLRGLRRALSRGPVLFLEIHASKLREFGSSPGETIDLLRSHGYAVSIFEDHRVGGGTVPLPAGYAFGDNEMVLAVRSQRS